ncbi:canalicular multispecific organic anion transporter 1-like [Galendromus occidentalis]|uniref:ABC-type glutathione-S-conjugate transporter n=1 Tax=Galendromus occidentalis TaxID=34638 RepID=A0AAJ7L6U9_9ACAR|nr:canalicular multispecific organic anion transporter 1-like [Galendromus occidentalis]
MRPELSANPFWRVGSCREELPASTECFEKTVLVSVLAIYMLCGGPIYLLMHRKRPRRPSPVTALFLAKIITSSFQVCLHSYSAYVAASTAISSVSDFLAPLLKTLIFSMVISIQIANRCKGFRSSAFLTVFWILAMLCELPAYYRTLLTVFGPARTSFALPTMSEATITMMTYPLIPMQFCLDTFSEKFPESSPELKRRNPIYSASCVSKVFFEFFSDVVIAGYQKVLSFEDLPDPIESMDSSSSFKEWESSGKNLRDPGARINLIRTLFKTYWPQLTVVWTLETMYVSLRITSFFALNEVFIFLNDPDAPAWKGFVYVSIIFIVYSVSSTLMRWADFFLLSLGIKIKSVLIAAIVRKSLRVDRALLENSTVGESVNLLAVDADKIHQFSNYVGNLIGCPFYVGLCTWMLWNFIGPSCLAGISVILLMMPVTAAVAGQSRAVQAKQMALKDSRLRYIGELLSNVKIVKFYVWETPFVSRILGVRNDENRELRKFAYWTAVLRFFWSVSPFLVSLFAFVSYLLVNDLTKIDANIAFVSLGLFNSMRFPLALIPDVISNGVQSLVSVRRIESFLNAGDLQDNVIGDRPGSRNAARWRSASLSWERSETTLRNIDLSVETGDLVAIVGEVGSGKSSLLNSLLGNMKLLAGSVDLAGSVAYVPQQVWIQNATIKQNIVFTQDFDRKLYERVVRRCCLSSDLRILPGGDNTEIGEKGINLSGGQKQRVSLARAVYQDRDVYLLDDPLSAVDAHVGAALFRDVIGNNTGMLKDKTRLLVTNTLSVLPNVDRIVVLKHGEIVEHGTYAELRDSKTSEFAKLLREHEKADRREAPEREPSVDIRDECIDSSLGWSSTSSSIDHYSKRAGCELISEETMQSGSVKLSVFTKYLSKMGFPLLLTIALGFASARAFDVLSGIWLSDWSNDELGRNSEHYAQRTKRILAYAAFGLSYGILTFVGAACLAHGTLSAARKLHNRMLNSIIRAPMSFFDTTPLGRLLNRFGKDVDQLDIQLPVAANVFLDMFFQVVGVIVLISVNVPSFLLVAIPLLAVFAYVQKVYMRSIRQIKRMEAVSRSPVYNHFAEMLNGLDSIRAYRAESYFVSTSDSKVDMTQNCSFQLSVGKLWLRTRLDMITNFLILAAGVLVVHQKGTADPNVAGFVISYTMGAAYAFNMIVHYASEAEASIVASERIEEYVDVPPEAPWKTNCVPDDSWPASGCVTFENYSTRYREGLNLVLSDVDLRIRSGEKVGIVGRTGAGKSSLTLSLFRMIEAAAGRLIIDDIDVAQLGLHDLRPRLTIIPQEPVIFSGTLRVNLDPNDEYTDGELWSALEKAHVKKQFDSNGLETEISEGGANLSLGQRQLVCLARAILRKKKILVMDEATAAVDVETDALIQETIRNDFSDCTIITIAHRLNTIMDSHTVIVMEAGAVVERGSPDALLRDPESRFHAMALEAGLLADARTPAEKRAQKEPDN